MNTSGLCYRLLGEADLADVAVLEAQAFPTPWSADQYRRIMEQGRCSLFGAHAGTRLAGYIAVSLDLRTGEMEVYNIAVVTECRRQGTGTRLLTLALEAARKIGIERAILEVRASNAPATGLYTLLGFSQVGVRTGYYHDTGEDALVLARLLK